MNRGIPEFLVIVILATMVVFVIAGLAGGVGDFPNERWAAAIAMICLAVWIGPRLLGRYVGNGGAALKAIALWLVIITAVCLLYVYGKDWLVSMGVNVT